MQEKIAGVVALCMKRCYQAQREGVNASDIVTSDLAALSNFSQPGLAAQWRQVVQARLSTWIPAQTRAQAFPLAG